MFLLLLLGLILETDISSGEDNRLFNVGPEQYVKQVFVLCEICGETFGL